MPFVFVISRYGEYVADTEGPAEIGKCEPIATEHEKTSRGTERTRESGVAA